MFDRFFDKVDATGDCWQWTGARSPRGYGNFAIKTGTVRGAHRVAWELLVGEIPEGLQVDHLCRNTSCVNPDHLELVPPGVNVRRSNAPSAHNASKTQCVNGHAFTEANTYEKPDGRRQCRACAAESTKRWRRKSGFYEHQRLIRR